MLWIVLFHVLCVSPVAHAVVLTGNASEVFQGFLLVAMGNTGRVGTFTAGDNSRLTCDVSVYTHMF